VAHLPDIVAREAYSHEVGSCGFWPGGDALPEPVFYSYAYPAPEGFAHATIQSAAARWDAALKEFVLPYEAVRMARDPDEEMLTFLQSTYEAAAKSARWDRASLEHEGEWPGHRQSG